MSTYQQIDYQLYKYSKAVHTSFYAFLVCIIIIIIINRALIRLAATSMTIDTVTGESYRLMLK